MDLKGESALVTGGAAGIRAAAGAAGPVGVLVNNVGGVEEPCFRAAAMAFLADDTLAGRIMLCRGGEPARLLPVVEEALPA